MCGIAGILDANHYLENQNIIFHSMIQSMKHRGPSDEGIYLEDHVALLHTRLAVVDIENGKQPMTRQGCVIVYNGECYNTDELREQLKEKGVEFSTRSDTEVILMAYILYGEKCLSMIRGIFSFAIYNSEKKTLFLARDPMGVKPLFYTFVKEMFLFASEIKTLLTHPLVQPVLDEQGIHQIAYLGPGKIQGSGIFKNIYELKSGEYGLYDFSYLEIHSYFEVVDTPFHDDFETTVNKVHDMVVDAVESQLVCDVELGAFLSGGLDSSILVAIASKAFQKQKKTLKTFSLEFEDNDRYFIPSHFQPTSDAFYVNIMVNTFKTDHTRIVLKSEDLIDSIYQAVDARDLPGMGDIDSALLLFCEKVKKHVDVVLSGECADEIFGGYPWFFDDNPSYFPWTQNLHFRNSLLNEKYQIDVDDYVGKLYQESLDVTPCLSERSEDIHMKQMTYLNTHWFMQTLLDRKDRMSMAVGLEARVPFCDPALYSYVYSIPWHFKQYHHREKGLLREAMKDLLPKEILERKKSPFPKTHHPLYLKALRQELEKLQDEPLWIIFNKHEVLKLLDEQSSVPWYGQLMNTPQTIAYLLQINYWLKKYKIQIQ